MNISYQIIKQRELQKLPVTIPAEQRGCPQEDKYQQLGEAFFHTRLMCAFLLNTTQPLAPMMAELRYLSYFMENSLSHVKLACFGRYSSSNTRVCPLTIPKLDCIGCALQGFMKGEAKGTRLTGSARQLPVFSF